MGIKQGRKKKIQEGSRHARWRIFGPNLQIKVLHGFNEKGEQKLIAKPPPKLTYKYPPLESVFGEEKKKKVAKLWTIFSRKIRARNLKQEQEKIFQIQGIL